MFRKWPRPAQPASLTLDLVEARLGTLALGMPSQAVAESLGPPSSYPVLRKFKWWLYSANGLCFEVTDERIAAMWMITAHDDGSMPFGLAPPYQPFSWPVRLPHGAERLDRLQEQTFRGLFGEPVLIDRDSEETVMRFRKRGVEIEIDLTPAGTLKRLSFFQPED